MNIDGGMSVLPESQFSGVFGPEGAADCSHGWSGAVAFATRRGTRGKEVFVFSPASKGRRKLFTNEATRDALRPAAATKMRRPLPSAPTGPVDEMPKQFDNQIDQLVYQRYALTPDEIRIVEEANK